MRLELQDGELFATPELLTSLRELPASAWPTRLTVSGRPTRAVDVVPLVDTEGFRQLEDLCLEEASWASVGRVFRAAPPRLSTLHVTRWAPFTPRPGVAREPLLPADAAAWPPALCELALSGGLLGDDDVERIAAAPGLPSLRALKIAHCSGTTGAGLGKLLATPRFAALELLSLPGSPVGDGGARAIASNPSLARVRRLELERAEIGDAGAAALLEGPQGLTHLDLRRGNSDANAISDGVRARLEARFQAGLLLDPPRWSPRPQAASRTREVDRGRGEREIDLSGVDREVAALFARAQSAADAARHQTCGLAHVALQVLELPACERACKEASLDRRALVEAQKLELRAAVPSKEVSYLDPPLIELCRSLRSQPGVGPSYVVRALAATGRLPAELADAWSDAPPREYPWVGAPIGRLGAHLRVHLESAAGIAEHELARIANLLRRESVPGLSVTSTEADLELRREGSDAVVGARVRGASVVVRARSGRDGEPIRMDESFVYDPRAKQFVDAPRQLSLSEHLCAAVHETLFPEIPRE